MKKLNSTIKIFLILIATASTTIFTGCSKDTPAKTVTPPVDTTRVAAITSVTPLKALAFSQITIYGSSFNTVIANNTISVNGVTAVIDSLTATKIVFTLPLNATSGVIRLVTGSTTLTYATSLTVVTPGTLSTYANIYLEHIAIDGSGTIYGDNGTDTIYRVTESGAESAYRIFPDTSGSGLWGSAIDASGNLYIAGSSAHVIYKISASGATSVFAGSGVAGHADGKGLAAEFHSPFGLAVDANGNVYTNDDGYVRKITPDGTVTTIAGTGVIGHTDGPALSATLGGDEGIAVDKKGNVYLSDNTYFVIRKISTAGIVSTVAGSGTQGFADGTGAAAQFYYPQAMAVDAGGNIFLSDNDFSQPVSTVRRITPDGTVSTFLKSTDYNSAVVLGPYASANTNFPDGITFDTTGNMYICNTLGNPGAVAPSAVRIVTKLTFQ